MKKKSLSDVKELFNKKTSIDKFELLSSNGAKDLNILCKKCNRVFTYKSLSNWIKYTKNPSCPYCGKNSKNISVDIIKERLKDYNFEMINPNEYKNTHTKMLVRYLGCSIHGPFYTTFNHIQQGLKCPTCANIKSKDCERLSLSDVMDRISKVPLFLEKYDIDISNYKRYNDRDIHVKCKKCNMEFSASLSSIVAGCGCPKCRESYIEKNTLNFLKENNFNYLYHFRGFDDLRGSKYPLEIDFVIKNTKIGDIYIELNGEFHYYFSDKFGDTDTTIEHDNKKINFFIEKNSSTFIVIPFWEFSNIYKILSNIENLDFLKNNFNITIISSNIMINKLIQPDNI